MEIKVKDLGSVDEKSMAQREEEVLEKAAAKNEVAEEPQVSEVVEETTPQQTESVEAPAETTTKENTTQSSELKEEDVLSFIKNRYNKEVSSVGDLFAQKESNEDLPEDVAAYLEYRKKTGRSFEDYSKLNRDFNAMDEKQLLREYYSATEDALDSEDIDYMMDDFSYDEEVDEESVIKKKKVAFKKEIGKAKKFFEKQKEMYKEPLESSSASISQDTRSSKVLTSKLVKTK